MKKHVPKVVSVIFLAIFVIYGFNNQHIFTSLLDVAVVSLIMIAIARLLIYVANGLFTKWTTEAFTRKLTVGESFYLGILSAIGNFFGPLLGGASIRAVYLKKVHKLSYSKFTSTLMGYYLILFIVNISAALMALMVLPASEQTYQLMAVFMVWLAALIVMMLGRLPARHRTEKLQKNKYAKAVISVIYDVEAGWRTIIKNRTLLMKMVTLALISYGVQFLIAFMEFQALGIEISFAALALYTTIVTVALLISITPGAIGVRETLLIIVGSTLFISTDQILQVAIIDRGVNFLLLVLLFLLTRSSALKKKLVRKELYI